MRVTLEVLVIVMNIYCSFQYRYIIMVISYVLIYIARNAKVTQMHLLILFDLVIRFVRTAES